MFRDRTEAGVRLARALQRYADRPDAIVIALPRGGVPVGYEVARVLHLDFDLLIVRKLGVPGNPELAMGAVAGRDVVYVDPRVVREARVSDGELAATVARERAEVERRERAWRCDGPSRPLEGRTVIVVDDGIATGASMRAALQALHCAKPARVVVAVPVAPAGTGCAFEELADETVLLVQPDWFASVGVFYDDFEQVEDAQVQMLYEAARRRADEAAGASHCSGDAVRSHR
jgi:putative phosphoribosyl transferase